MFKKIHWLGHAAFRIDAEKVIYLDPFKIKDGAKKADLILITHGHSDHLSPEDIVKIATGQTKFIAPPSCAKKLSGNVTPITRGQKINVDGFEIQAVPAYNIGKNFHPESSDNVGYVLTVEGARVYHAGDTDVIPEMKEIDADIALLPCGGTYTMTGGEAAQAAKLINPKIVVPMHWGSIIGSKKDAETMKDLLSSSYDVRIMGRE
ncbi:MAG: MBL fold metallo-hydrolase [Candidatus Omnitrophica bacterium]|nr:MBL fold metallo-hydrolase [Candidatus Omnitrophota bacterium]